MSGWDNRPVIPKLPKPRPPQDLVQCEGCPDQVPRHEITEYAGYALCGDCHLDAAERLDRQITRWLATVTA
jgi:hypothetical protein